MNGAVPSLQCRVCLCLYHTKCAGLGSIQGTIHGYVCKKCQLEAKKTVIVSSPTSVTVPLSNTSPPPLTPIRMMTPQPPTLTRPAAPGTRAQLISPPQPTHRPALVPTVPTLVRVSRPEARTKGTATVSATTAVTPASIVGSVTTWLPPSSRVSVARATVSSSPTVSFSTTSTSCAIPSTRPAPPVSQGLVRVGGRRYVVMPKHNVLSVSGTSASKQRDLRPKPSPQQQQQQTAASAFLVGGQNPPGVLLVPVLGPSQVTDRRPQSVLLVNGGTVLATPPIASKDAAVENRKRKAEAEDGVVSKKPRPMEVASNDPNLELHKFMQGFMSHLTSGYNAMLHVFEYLKVQELLRASRVCRLWRSLATHESLWRTVRLKNSPIADWKGCAAALARCGTRHLDMRKMLVPTGRAEDWWASFGANIGRVPSLESVELSRCPAAVVERVAQQCPQLITLSALSIRDQSINLSSVGQLKNLQELRIKNLSGMYINGKLDGLKELTNLKHLSLTMVKNLGHAGCAVLGELNTLETLEIGECCDLPSSFGNQTLSRLSSLHRLRLEKGQGDSCPTFSLLGGVRTLPALVTLELINFDVKPGFDAALARCTNVRRLLIIPTYISQSATTNHTVLSGVTKLGESLTHLVWGVTHELLRVTELFVDQCEDQKVPTYRKKSTEEGGSSAGDSIPVLRPVPGCTPSGDAPDGSPGVGSEWNSGSVSGSQPTGAPQVDILPLTKLQKMLNTSLPRTKIKILKVPFQATWRQYISDSDF